MSGDPQQTAALSTDPNLLVVAPPGCGKTELLALRAQALIPRLLPHQRILALTFTNRAKANLQDRLRRLLGSQRCRRYVSVRNFHGHAAEIIKAHGGTLGLDVATLAMPTTKTLKKALKVYSSDQGANRAAAELFGRIKRQPLNDDEVLAALAMAGDALAHRVEQDRIAANQLHYDDLLRHAQRLLQVDEVANLYRQHYGAVLVDEFQDLSLQQLDIVLRTCTTVRTFAGDPLQGIYSWAGAAPQEVEASLRSICGEPIQLTVSYRSSPGVLAMLNGISRRMGAAPLQAHDPDDWPGGGVSAALVFNTRSEEAASIARVSGQIIGADPSASVGVISRSGWRRGLIDTAFGELPELPCRRWDLAIEDPTILDRLRTAAASMPSKASIDEARTRVLAGIDPSDVDTIEQVEDAFDQLAAGSGTSLGAALNQFRSRADQAVIGPGVHLLNAHTGKGQQFDWVFVPGVEEDHVPDRRSTEGELLAEEQRVLLVMLSRARHGVIVTRSVAKHGRHGSYGVAPQSRWWSDLAAAASMDHLGLSAHLDKYYNVT